MAESGDSLQKVITKCWDDEAFKERLLADPAATLAAEGVEVPEGVTIRVAVDTEEVRTLVIPAAPSELGDWELDRLGIAAGNCATDCATQMDYDPCYVNRNSQ